MPIVMGKKKSGSRLLQIRSRLLGQVLGGVVPRACVKGENVAAADKIEALLSAAGRSHEIGLLLLAPAGTELILKIAITFAPVDDGPLRNRVMGRRSLPRGSMSFALEEVDFPSRWHRYLRRPSGCPHRAGSARRRRRFLWTSRLRKGRSWPSPWDAQRAKTQKRKGPR